MSCEFCVGQFFRNKLGRCKQCMMINFILLIVVTGIYFFVDMSQWLAVQEVALLMFILALAILMTLHIVAWCFYRFKGDV